MSSSAATPARTILIRIDDRLIHGQVSIGWAARLKPDRILVLDDEAAADSWENELVCSACPESIRAEVLGVEEGARMFLSGAYAGEKIIVLLRSVKSALKLLDAGFPMSEVNIGGLHHHQGSRPVLPYVYLDPSEIEALKVLAGRGVKLVAQDLPGNKSFDLKGVLARGEV